MRFLHNTEICEDGWRVVSDGALSVAGDIIVPPQDLEVAGRRASGRCGLVLDGDDVVEDCEPAWLDLPLIAVRFTPFTDGRGYSSAATLRRAGYHGDLRAIGEVQCDQLQFLLRAGFSTVELPEAASPAGFVAARQSYTYAYQVPGHNAGQSLKSIRALRRA